MKVKEENFINAIKAKNEKGLRYVIDNYAWIIKTVLKKHLFYLPQSYEECMNDCLLAIWENIDSYDPSKGSFKNWVGAIAKYKSIGYIRKHLRRMEIKTGNIEAQHIAIEDQNLKKVLEQELSQETEKMLNSLNEEDRAIFIKLYLKQEDMNQISKDLGLSKPVLYNRISRGKTKMRQVAERRF